MSCLEEFLLDIGDDLVARLDTRIMAHYWTATWDPALTVKNGVS